MARMGGILEAVRRTEMHSGAAAAAAATASFPAGAAWLIADCCPAAASWLIADVSASGARSSACDDEAERGACVTAER